MKKIFVSLFITALMLCGAHRADAQWHSEWSYGTAFPSKAFHDFVPSTGWWNWQFQARKQINKRYELGGAVSWQYFSHNFGRETTVGDGFALTANVTSFTNILGFQMINQYNLSDGGNAIPFVRLGLGTAYQNQQEYIGLYTVSNNSWQMMLSPEAGVRLELNYYLGLAIAAGYSFMPESGGVVPTSFWTLKFGLTWIRF